MLARLLRWTLLAQLGLGALLGVWLGVLWVQPRLGGASALWSLVAVALLMPVLAHTLLLALGVAWARRHALSRQGWGRLYANEWWVALDVFALRQPWARRAPGAQAPSAAPPPGEHPLPVLLVHGYLCNHRVWDELAAALRARGHWVLAVDLEPVFSDIDAYSATLEAGARALLAACPSRQLAVVAHSMGGLAARAWLRAQGDARVATVLTLGSPHQGTALARATHTPNGAQMRPGSAWLGNLAASESAKRRAKLHLAWSSHDNVVFPAHAQGLEGSPTQRFDGLGHLQLCRDRAVHAWIFDQLAQARRSATAR